MVGMRLKTRAALFILAGGFLLAASAAASGTGYSLVSVKGDLEFSQVLPGYSYSKQITVEWAAPPEVLKGLDADRIPVQVNVFSNSGLVDFLDSPGSVTAKNLSFTLACEVKDGACEPSL